MVIEEAFSTVGPRKVLSRVYIIDDAELGVDLVHVQFKGAIRREKESTTITLDVSEFKSLAKMFLRFDERLEVARIAR